MKYTRTISSLYTTVSLFFFFFNDTATTEIYTLSLHDALPISRQVEEQPTEGAVAMRRAGIRLQVSGWNGSPSQDRKSTRLNSSHVKISYAVFCLKKKKKKQRQTQYNSQISIRMRE